MKEIKNIIIVGGGNSGYLTALGLVNKGIDVTLIDPPHLPTIGVGESTQPAVTFYLKDFCKTVGFEYMPHVGATFKLGVRFEGWADHDIFVDSEDAKSHEGADRQGGLYDFLCKNKIHPDKFNHTCDAYVMAKNNLSPYRDGKISYMGFEMNEFSNANQWDQEKATEYFRQKCLKFKNFNLIKDTVLDVSLSESGEIDELILKNNKIKSDLYIDATGFRRLLIDKVSPGFVSFSKSLLNDRAIVLRKKYKDPQKECFPYTKATAMSAGWMWSIPTYDDMAHGYVHSSNFISLEQAEIELREKTNEYDSSVDVVDFSPGIKTPIAAKNVLAVGLSSSFIEPLEATNLSTTVIQVANFILNLKEHDNKFFITENLMNDIDADFQTVIDEIKSFIFCHYYFAPKNDTPYWHYIKTSVDLEEYSSLLKEIEKGPITNQFLRNEYGNIRMFLSGHWFQLLYPYNTFNNYKPIVDHGVDTMGKTNLEHKIRSNKQKFNIKSFPNHYDYLTEWYESC